VGGRERRVLKNNCSEDMQEDRMESCASASSGICEEREDLGHAAEKRDTCMA
jgi:hypothetical protein